jgi:uncharacterized membrane protein
VFTSWGWRQAWVNISLVLLVVMTIMGPVINLRRIHEIDNAANATTELTAELMEKVKNKALWKSVNVMTMLAFAIVLIMTLKAQPCRVFGGYRSVNSVGTGFQQYFP